MTDEPEDPHTPPAPFPVHPEGSPFPPLAESVAPPPDPPSDWIEAANAHDLAVSHDPGRENALVALGRFAFPPAPPLDDEGVAARDRRWTSRAVAVAAVFLLVFNAVSPLNWSRQQPPGWLPDTVRQLSEVWAAQLAVFAVDQPRQGLRETWDAARRARFIGQAPAPDGSTPARDS